MPSSAPTLDASAFELVGTLDDEALDVLAQLLVDFDAEVDQPVEEQEATA